MFCPKCGSILRPKKEDNKKILYCSCGFKQKNTDGAKIREVIRETSKKVEIIEKDSHEVLPQTDAECPKCGNNKAYYWMVQTRAADEPETKFLRCGKCKHTWREYD